MAWTCGNPSCGALVAVDTLKVCPACEQEKQAWTLQADQTRTLTVGVPRARLFCLRGEAHPRADGGVGAPGVAWRATQEVTTLPKALALGLASRGLLPDPHDLWQARMLPASADSTWALTLTIPRQARALEEQVLDFERRPDDLDEDGAFTACFLCVHGPEAADAIAFPGIHVLDVTDDTELGHAPRVEVKGFRRRQPISLALVARAADEPPGPEAVRALLRGLHFETDKAFLLPSAMRGIGQLKRVLAARARTALLVVGHTDTTGSPEHNRALSDERARSMLQFLRDDVDGWLALYGTPTSSKPWGRREDQLMLSALPGGGAPPLYPGAPTGHDDAPTAAATRAFQRWSNAARGTTLDDDGVLGPLTRRELIAAYMELDGQTLAPDTVTATHGCGEFHPEAPTADGEASEANRRAELFLFPGAVDPAPQVRCPAPGCAEYARWRERATTTIDLSQDPAEASFVVTEAGGARPLEDATVELTGLERRADRTDARGLVRFTELVPGDYEVAARKPGFAPTLLAFRIEAGVVEPKAPAERHALAARDAAPGEGDGAPTPAGLPTPIALTREPPRFEGRAGKAGQPGPRVVFAQGDPITLEWSFRAPLAPGVEVFLEGGGAPRQVQAEGPPFTFQYEDFPAAADGTWSLVLVMGAERDVAARVEGIGITRFEAVSHPEAPGVLLDLNRRPHEPALGRAQPPRLRDSGDEAGVIAVKRDAHGNLVEPGHAARYRWSICAPPGAVDVVLEVLHNGARQFPPDGDPAPLRAEPGPKLSFDVTARASRDLGAPATFDVREDTKISWDVSLHLLEAGSAPPTADELPRRKRLASSVLRLAKGLPLPGLADVELVAGDGAFRPGQVAAVGRDASATVRWTIEHHEPRDGLDVVVVRGAHAQSRGLTPLTTEVLRPVRAHGEPVPAEDTKATGERALKQPLPREEGDYTLFVRLNNDAGVVSERAIAVKVSRREVSLRLRLVRHGTNEGVPLVPLVARPLKGGPEQRVTTDRDGVAAFTIELPMKVSCPFPADGVGLTAATAFAPEQRERPKEPTARTVERYVQLVRKVELAHPDWSSATVVGALRRSAGYDDEAFQDLYDLPPQPELQPVKAEWGAAPASATRLVVRCRAHRISRGETLESIAAAHRITRRALALFNWNTDDEDRIDRCLGALVGCRSVGKDGRYVLHEGDEPGVLHVPAPWEHEVRSTDDLTIELFPCEPPWTDLLSADEVVELEWRLSKHATDEEIDGDPDARRHALAQGRQQNGLGHPAKERRETGIAQDRTGAWVGLGHVVTGIAAGLNRHERHDLANRQLRRKSGWFIHGQLAGAAFVAFHKVDNLYTATIAGDLGQEAVLHHVFEPELRRQVPFIGFGTEATDAEVMGDIDGFLLGWMLSTGGQRWLDGVGRRFPAEMRTSELLERYYGDRADMKLPAGNVGRRIQLFRDATICPPDKLRTETVSFASLYVFGERGPGKARAATYDVEPDAAAAAAEFQRWLRGRRDP